MLPFERTVCACAECRSHCRRAPGYLIPTDIGAIAEHLVTAGELPAVEDIADHLRASKGALVGDSVTRRTFRIGTITPRMENGRCVFLDDNDRCRIHAVAPFGCAYFDAHMSAREGATRSAAGLRLVQASPLYAQLRQVLMELLGEAEPLAAP